jgi:hypothetical protein
MTSGGDNKWRVDGVWVHATLVIVVHGDKSPVGDNASDADGAVWAGTSDEVFYCGGVEELDVGEGEDFGEEGRSEKCLFKKLVWI